MNKWKVLASRLLLSRPPWLKVTEQRCQLPNGHIIDGYLLVEGRNVAMVFPLTEDGKVLLVEQYKHGTQRAMWDLPAGYIDAEDASPLEAAKRELLEETGYAADEWVHLISVYHDPNRSDNMFHFFLALGARPAGVQHLDPTEELEIHAVAPSDLERLMREGKVISTASVAGIELGYTALARRGLLHVSASQRHGE